MVLFSRICALFLAALLLLVPTAALRAQEQPNLLIVLDGSGSMWGQVGGRTKIELARDALSQVLSEATPDMQIGMLAYGHRVRGQCSDIEMLVPNGPAGITVPAILDSAQRLNPLGMTPLSDAVMQAAQLLRSSEQAATVVLLTDGVETCGGDPCALGRMLESQGVDFTAHVVGFDMTDAEQRTVSCLATETGGLFLAANDAEDLARALRETIIAAPVPAPDPGPVLRQVNITLRDTAGGDPINGRQIQLFVEPQTPGGTAPEGLRVTQDQPVTATGDFLPGLYTAYIRRATQGDTPVSLQVTLEVPEGTGPLAIDLVIGARLRLTALAHAGLPMPPNGGNLPFAAYGSSAGRAFFVVHPVIDGAIDTSIDFGGVNSFDVALPPGEYFIRGGLSRSFSRERLVTVLPGQITDYVFDFEAARVFVDMRDAQGFPVERLSTYFYDGPGGPDFLNGGGQSAGGLLPFYLPVGTWRVDAGMTGGGERRAQAVFAVSRPGEDITLSLTEGGRATSADLARLTPGCIANLGGEYGCLVEALSPSEVGRSDGIDPDSVQRALEAAADLSFAGVWSSSHQTLTLHQQGRRVWGERSRGVLEGEVSADGGTLRGTWTTGSDWGTFEFVLDAQRQAFTGRWGRGADPDLSGGTWTGSRQSDLPSTLTRPEAVAMARPAGASGPVFDGFMQAVRDADPALPQVDLGPVDPVTVTPPEPVQGLIVGPDLNPGFTPSIRRDFADASGRTVISVVFGDVERGGDTGSFADGWAWLATGWCGADCAEEILPVGGQFLDDVPNAYVRLDRGGLFPVYSAEYEQLVFEVTAAGLAVHGIGGFYNDGQQLGINREVIERTFGTYTTVAQTPVGMAGWPALPGGAGGVLVEPAVEPVTDPAAEPVGIGSIDVLPIGVFAFMTSAPDEPLSEAFDRLFGNSPIDQPQLAMDCARDATVIYPDGLIAARALRPDVAMAGGAPYETYSHERCEQSGPILACRLFDGAPENGLETDQYSMTVAAGPRGSFALTLEGESYLYRSCYGPDGFLSTTELAPDGVPMWQHVVERRDGGPGLTLGLDGQFIGTGTVEAPPMPTPAPVNSAVVQDFAAAAGIWAQQDPSGDPEAQALSCFEEPAVLHPDGVFHIFELVAGSLPTRQPGHLSCSSMEQCRIMDDVGRPNIGSGMISLTLVGPRNMRSCQDGGTCRELARCDPMDWTARERASGLADSWEERVMQRN